MLYLERIGEGPVRLVVECVHPGAFHLAALALDALIWRPDMQDSKEYMQAVRIAAEQLELEPNSKLIIIGGQDDR